MIRLYVEARLTEGASIAATENQAHHLGGVMRRAPGDTVRLFNGRDGEWDSRIATLSRGKASFAAETRVRPQSPDADLWLAFAVLKRVAVPTLVACGRLDLVTPVVDHEQIAALIPGARLAIVEDSGHLSTIEQPTALNALLASWLAVMGSP